MVITKEMLAQRQDGKSIRGVILCKNYAVKKTKTGKDYIEGQLMSGEMIPFKSWSGSSAMTRFMNEDFSNCPVFISGSWNEYQGSFSIIVDSVEAVADYSVEQFMESKYDTEGYLAALKSSCTKNLSRKGMDLLNMLLFDNEDVLSKFKIEFAAMGHHDNCLSGLVAHTYKVVQLMSWVLRTYSELLYDGCEYASDAEREKAEQDRRDLLIIGACIHDIGKIDEMHFGVYQPNSAISHRILGLDYLYAVRKQIETLYSEKWYRDLQSILVGHHDEWADPATTVVAYIVNRVDVLDAQMTGLAQNIVKNSVQDTSGKKIYVDKRYLTI